MCDLQLVVYYELTQSADEKRIDEKEEKIVGELLVHRPRYTYSFILQRWMTAISRFSKHMYVLHEHLSVYSSTCPQGPRAVC